jgi:hypothetical protein
MRKQKPEPAEMPDWLLTDIGLRRSDLPRRRRWFIDLFRVHGPVSPVADRGWEPNWRRE